MASWHLFRFRMKWTQDKEPSWWIDLYIIDRVIRNAVRAHRDQLETWRFHRMADPAAGGHVVTLLTYCDQGVASSIESSITASDVLADLMRSGLLSHYFLEEEDGKAARPGIEGTSDTHWPVEIQRSWPYFIQGVSEMLLQLVAEIGGATGLPEDPEARYKRIEAKMRTLWRDNGSHAFLHHINALFGYAPIVARPRSVTGYEVIF